MKFTTAFYIVTPRAFPIEVCFAIANLEVVQWKKGIREVVPEIAELVSCGKFTNCDLSWSCSERARLSFLLDIAQLRSCKKVRLMS